MQFIIPAPPDPDPDHDPGFVSGHLNPRGSTIIAAVIQFQKPPWQQKPKITLSMIIATYICPFNILYNTVNIISNQHIFSTTVIITILPIHLMYTCITVSIVILMVGVTVLLHSPGCGGG